MPLPIFDQIESEWFRSSQRRLLPPPPEPAASAPSFTPPAPPQPFTPAAQPPASPVTPPVAPGQRPSGTEADWAAAASKPGPISVSGRPVSAPSAPAASATPPAPQAPSAPVPPTVGPLPRRPQQDEPAVTSVPPTPSVPTAQPAATSPLPPPSGDTWSSPADAGWKAAQAASEAPSTTTEAGLPKRVPMAHFIPGRVEQPQRQKARPAAHRSPDAVRGVLSSYRHGLEQGRQASHARHTGANENNTEQEEK
jgi:hypothetical protein